MIPKSICSLVINILYKSDIKKTTLMPDFQIQNDQHQFIACTHKFKLLFSAKKFYFKCFHLRFLKNELKHQSQHLYNL